MHQRHLGQGHRLVIVWSIGAFGIFMAENLDYSAIMCIFADGLLLIMMRWRSIVDEIEGPEI